MSNEKWTDVTVIDLMKFGFKAVGAGSIITVCLGLLVGAVLMVCGVIHFHNEKLQDAADFQQHKGAYSEPSK
jgi:hypothetical protein